MSLSQTGPYPIYFQFPPPRVIMIQHLHTPLSDARHPAHIPGHLIPEDVTTKRWYHPTRPQGVTAPNTTI
jgi:hypothetical protein